MKRTITFLFALVFMGANFTFAQSSSFLDFDGYNDYVKYSDDATLGRMDGATDYTIEAWIFPIAGRVAEYDRVLQRYYSFAIVMYDGNNDGNVEDWYFQVYDKSSSSWKYYNTQGDATLNLDSWNHISVINNSTDGSLKLYVNGLDVTLSGGYPNRNQPSSSSNDNLYIGQKGNGTSYFGGYIDEVRLKNVAEDISNLQTKITDNEYSSDSNTAGLFHFDEGSGSSTVNEASSSNATLKNGVIWRFWDYVSGHSLPLDNRFVWNGLTDTDWATSTNWDPGVTPASSDNVIIPDVTNDPIIGSSTTTSCVNLDIKSNTTLSIRGALTVSGTLTNNAGTSGLFIEADASGNGSLIESNGVSATVQQHLSADDWHLVSMPVSSAQAKVYNGLYLYEWSEADSVFTNITDSTYNLTLTYGYYAYSQSSISSPTDVEYSGTLNAGDKAVSWMTYTSQNYSGQDGWNLAGNPYPSGLKWDNTWSQQNLTSTVYVFDAGTSGNWISYNYTTGLGDLTDGEIPPTQGFFVLATAANPSMTIPNSARIHTSGFYKESNDYENVFGIKISSNLNSYSDKFIVGINPDATDNFDYDYDAYKLMGFEEAPQLYSCVQDIKYSVNLFPGFTGHKAIPLSIRTGAEGEYTFTAEGLEFFDINIDVYLEDVLSGEMINLRDNPEYTFYSTPGTDNSRFVLHFNPDLTHLKTENTANDISIYSFGKSVFINNLLRETCEVSVYDISGKLIAQQSVNPGFNELKLQSQKGYYFVKVISSTSVTTQKLYIQ